MEGTASPIGKEGKPLVTYNKSDFFGATSLLDQGLRARERFDTKAMENVTCLYIQTQLAEMVLKNDSLEMIRQQLLENVVHCALCMVNFALRMVGFGAGCAW